MVRFIVLTFFLFQACTQTNKSQSAISFYYWKTTFNLTETEKRALQHNHVEKLYVRYFDIALRDGAAVPVSPVLFQVPPTNLSVVPVVYIKNEVMLLPSLNVDDLARKVVSYVDQINTRYSIQSHEIQLDCDWTLTSREKYFKFIDAINTLTDKKLSATIRLHQIKYWKETGVPAVDHGILMYYNMGHLSADSSNSIYERKIAQRYLEGLKTYPLKLNIALPVFSWGIHIRNNKVIGLLNKIDKATFIQDKLFESKTPSFFEVKESGLKLGHYVEKGDRIKIESSNGKDLHEMASDLKDYIRQDPEEIIFFDLDDFNLRHYEEEDFFKNVNSAF